MIEVNENLKYILQEFYENKLSHIFLIETNNIDNCKNELYLILKEIIAKEENNDSIKNIDIENLTNILEIFPDGAQIKKDAVMELLNFCNTLSSTNVSKFYIINNAELLFNNGNRLLKFIEEPEKNIYGFMICNDHHKLLDTIVSRCQLIKCKYENDNEINDEELFKYADEYIGKVENSKSDLLLNLELLSHVKERQYFISIFNHYINIYKLKMTNNNYFPGNNFDYLNAFDIIEINKRLLLFSNIMDMLSSNCNLELTLNYFVIEMGKIND